ncbi:hypothetical protein [Nostoc sp. NZL]|nr:hypothetical protein [Nostoc sp. NZL]
MGIGVGLAQKKRKDECCKSIPAMRVFRAFEASLNAIAPQQTFI